jgi:hypothetical protein
MPIYEPHLQDLIAQAVRVRIINLTGVRLDQCYRVLNAGHVDMSRGDRFS